MKAIAIVLIGVAAVVLIGLFVENAKHKAQIASLREQVQIIASDYAACLDEKQAALDRVKAQAEHHAHCAWISREQIVAVEGAQGHWLQLALDGPGYNLPLNN
jgi:Tfp pilus assembly protein PilN